MKHLRLWVSLCVGLSVVVIAGACGQAQPACDSASCPFGCCDSSGQCQAATLQACGFAGAACTACLFTETCQLGRCSAGGTSTGGGTGGGGGGLDAGFDAGVRLQCLVDNDCALGKLCNAVSNTCVPACASSADCPASEKTCKTANGSVGTSSMPGYCQCTTDALCSNAVPGAVCSVATKQCAARCTASTQCPRRTQCETATGQCVSGTVPSVDAGIPGACSSSSPQPDVCGYGSVCPIDNRCVPLSDGSCSNIAGASRPTWTSNSVGPVIFNVVDEVDDATACTTGYAFTVTVYAYAGPGTVFPASKSASPTLTAYGLSGAGTNVTSNLLSQANYTVSVGGTQLSAKFTLCSATTSPLATGFAFANGNGVCTTLVR